MPIERRPVTKKLLARELDARLASLGLRFDPPRALQELVEGDLKECRLVHSRGTGRYRIAYSPSMTGAALRWARLSGEPDERLLLLGPRITERSADLLRTLGIDYLDGSGNASIDFEGVHIDVRGRRADAALSLGETPMSSIRSGVNLFSAKRSQVIFAILTWPELLGEPVREVAHASNVSLGLAQETLQLLEDNDILNADRHLSRASRSRLIDQWVSAYPANLSRQISLGTFSGDISRLRASESTIYISGEAASSELRRPENLILYSAVLPKELIVARRWRRDDEEPNILIRRQFWTEQRPLAPGVNPAPWLLTYADLLASGDSRQKEAAHALRDAHDRPE